MKKNILYITLFISALFLSSCEDMLELEPISEIGANGFFATEAEVNAGVVAVYEGFSYIPNFEYALTEMRSDNSRTRTSEGEWAQFESMNVDAANQTVSSYWTYSYNVIYRANTLIPYLDVVEDETLRNQFEGEIYFLRALTYFNLVRLYGAVPLIDKVVAPEDAEANSVRVAESEIYDFIITDLTNAITLLPGRENTAEGRATKAAAQAILAKVYLTLHNYTSALPLLTDIIANPDYSLITTSYNDIFYTDINANSEVIFAIQYIRGDANNSQEFSYAFSPQGRAGGLNWPTLDLISAVDTIPVTGDARASTLFYFNPLAGSSGDYANGKFLDPDNLEEAGSPWIISRLADVYLMYCEAVLAGATSTTDATALVYINQIRSRANLSDLTEITPDNLLLERRIELAFENHRLFDLIRFGKADEVLGAFALTEEAGFVYNSNMLLLPIPQREISIYNMGQNPGY